MHLLKRNKQRIHEGEQHMPLDNKGTNAINSNPFGAKGVIADFRIRPQTTMKTVISTPLENNEGKAASFVKNRRASDG
jgi:hypothetical protein